MSQKQSSSRTVSASDLPAGSLNRAVTLLEALAQGPHEGCELSDLVARTSLPRPTVYRVIEMLMTVGWVTRDPETRRFNLGADLAALGYSAISRHPLERTAATILSALAETLNQVVYLSIRSGLDFVCIGRYESASQIQVGRGWAGMRGPFGLTPACMGMFSALSAEEVRDIVKICMPRYRRMEGFDEGGFRESVARSMDAGYGIYGNIVLDRTTSGLGVAICDPSGYPIAGIGTTYITAWSDEAQQKTCIEELQKAAREIERALLISPRSSVP